MRMKKLFLIFILLGFIAASAAIDERKTDVYFANGINTDEQRARDAAKDLNFSFHIYNSTLYKLVADWKVAYNHTHGIGIDLYESMIQKIYEDQTGNSFIPLIWNAGPLGTLLKFSFKGS